MSLETQSRSRWFVLASATFAASLALTGCGKASEKLSEKAAEKIVESQAGGEVDLDLDSSDGSYEITTEDGTLSMGAEMPDGWPDDVPLPDDLIVTGGSNMSSGDEVMVVVAGVSSMSADDIMALYADELSDWTEQSKQEFTAEQRVVNTHYVNGDRLLSVGTSEDGSETTFTATYAVTPA